MYEEEVRPPQAVAARRDVTLAKEEILQTVWAVKNEIQADLEKHSEITGNVVRYNSRGFLDVFIPAFLAVVAGSYLVKYWL